MLRSISLISISFFCFNFHVNVKGIVIIQTDNLQWGLTNANESISITGSVPGGVYTDLMSAGILNQGDFYYRYNDLNYRWVSYEDWRYKTYFELPASLGDSNRVVLEFDGLDTKAEILLNNSVIGECHNMFSTCIVDVKEYLTFPTTVELTILFQSPITFSQSVYDNYYLNNDYEVVPQCLPDNYQGECHANTIRKMQSSFSWDWGPAFPNLGIWKPWRITGWSSLKLSAISFESIPVTPLPLAPDFGIKASWIVNFKIFYDLGTSLGSINGTLRVSLDGQEYFNFLITIEPLVSEAGSGFYGDSFVVPEDSVETWWPNGFGNQSLYTLTATFTPTDFAADEESSISVRVGFRTIEVDESYLSENDTSLGRYFRIKVNNIFIFLKGSNWIPAHVLPEQVTPEHTRQLLLDAKNTYQNSLRVWGGGIYESDAFYDTADELGILIWQDMMFACSMYPADDDFLAISRRETITQVKRLQHHASLLLWGTNNENEAALKDNWYGTGTNYDQYKADYIKLYVDTVAAAINQYDGTRRVIISSPSNGIESELEGYIAVNPSDDRYGDRHFYDYNQNGWSWEIYPIPRFASEYGFQSWPSFYTLSSVFAEDELDISSPMMEHRQHHPSGQTELENQLLRHFDYNATYTSFQDYLYLVQLHQAISVKTESEHYRRHRDTVYRDGRGSTMGALYWQLNDIWQGASWASIEYGGRWKLLHYYAKKFFSPLVAIATRQNTKIQVTIVNDMPKDFLITDYGTVTLVVEVNLYQDQATEVSFQYELTEDIKFQSAQQVLELDLEEHLAINSTCSKNPPAGDPYDNCFLTFSLKDLGGSSLTPDNFLLLGEPKNGFLPSVALNVTTTQDSDDTIHISITADRLAMFVFLESPFEGVFSDNGFIVPWSQRVNVQFVGRQSVPVDEFRSQLNVTYLSNSYDVSLDD